MKVNLEILDAAYLYAEKKIENLNTKQLVPKMMMRRRLTDVAKIVVELVDKVDVNKGRIIYGSAYGELVPTANILNSMYDKSGVSPTDFQNSVYNTAVSYLSLLQKNKSELTTISSGDDTSNAVLNVGTVKALDTDEILLIVADSININNIEQINNCIEYLECGVALKVKVTNQKAQIDLKQMDKKRYEKFLPSVHEMLYIAQEYQKGKKIVEICL